VTDIRTFVDDADEVLDVVASEARRAEYIVRMKRDAAQREKDFVSVLSTFEGRRLIWSLCAPIWRISYTGTRGDTDFREGERNVALRIWAELLQHCPTLAHKMQEENQL